MPRPAFKNINGNTLSDNTRKISLSNDDNKEIQLDVVNYNIVAEGFRVTIENHSKEEIYQYLKDNDVFFKVITLGIHNSVILLTEFDYLNHL